jgi:hypothetical protein
MQPLIPNSLSSEPIINNHKSKLLINLLTITFLGLSLSLFAINVKPDNRYELMSEIPTYCSILRSGSYKIINDFVDRDNTDSIAYISTTGKCDYDLSRSELHGILLMNKNNFTVRCQLNQMFTIYNDNSFAGNYLNLDVKTHPITIAGMSFPKYVYAQYRESFGRLFCDVESDDGSLLHSFPFDSLNFSFEASRARCRTFVNVSGPYACDVTHKVDSFLLISLVSLILLIVAIVQLLNYSKLP